MGQSLKIEYDMEEMVIGIKEAVKEELKPEIAEEIRTEIKDEIKKEMMDIIKEQIPEDTSVWLKGVMEEIYNTEIIKVGGGWDKDAKEYTLKEYIIEQVKQRIVNNNCSSSTRAYSDQSFGEWFRDKCVGSDIQKIIDKEIKSIRDEVNKKVKSMFDDSTKQMLSETVLNVLMANDTYKRIENNIGSIASKQN